MDIIKHLKYFDPSKHEGSIAVIGAGATGSALVLQLAKLGLKNINVYDFDKIEEHNISNQLLYGVNTVGCYKVDILAEDVNELVGRTSVFGFKAKLTSESFKLHETTVFFCVDTMKARKEIFEHLICMNFKTNLLIDMRINATSGSISTINPLLIDQCAFYDSILYTDENVLKEEGNCGVVPSIGATASLAANYAIWLFINWVMNKNRTWFEWRFGVMPPTFVTTTMASMEDYIDQIRNYGDDD